MVSSGTGLDSSKYDGVSSAGVTGSSIGGGVSITGGVYISSDGASIEGVVISGGFGFAFFFGLAFFLGLAFFGFG
ncbi:hypothetical protein ACFLQ6_03285 [Thermoproteota archaeon]